MNKSEKYYSIELRVYVKQSVGGLIYKNYDNIFQTRELGNEMIGTPCFIHCTRSIFQDTTSVNKYYTYFRLQNEIVGRFSDFICLEMFKFFGG